MTELLPYLIGVAFAAIGAVAVFIALDVARQGGRGG